MPSAWQLEVAMRSAAQAFASWRSDEDRPREALRTCAGVLEARAGELAGILTREQGKPLDRATEEIMGAVVWLRHTASLEIPVEVLEDSEEVRVEVRRRPHGVVAAITPWNDPVLLGVWKIAAALLGGNTVVLKPSPGRPEFFSSRLIQLKEGPVTLP